MKQTRQISDRQRRSQLNGDTRDVRCTDNSRDRDKHEERELKIKILSAWIREAAKVAGKREAQLERLDGDPYAASHLKAKWFLMWHYGATLQHSQTCEREVELIELESWLKASSTISMSRLIQQTCFDKWRQKVRAWKRKVRARSVRARAPATLGGAPGAAC